MTQDYVVEMKVDGIPIWKYPAKRVLIEVEAPPRVWGDGAWGCPAHPSRGLACPLWRVPVFVVMASTDRVH
jgi:hypothetical protein